MNEFSRARRLLEKSDFDQVFQDAKKLVSPHFIFLYRENTLGFARLGMALSKKMIAKAHDRTRIKRLLRETFRVSQHLPAVDVVVLARPKVGQVENPVLFPGLQKSWFKLCLLRHPELSERSSDGRSVSTHGDSSRCSE